MHTFSFQLRATKGGKHTRNLAPAGRRKAADRSNEPSYQPEWCFNASDTTTVDIKSSGSRQAYQTENLISNGKTWHDLGAGRFYEPEVINGQRNITDGPIKTFTLRGIKDSPPYLHDGRLLTLEDTVEYFNLVLSLNLSAKEKESVVAYMRQL